MDDRSLTNKLMWQKQMWSKVWPYYVLILVACFLIVSHYNSQKLEQERTNARFFKK